MTLFGSLNLCLPMRTNVTDFNNLLVGREYDTFTSGLLEGVIVYDYVVIGDLHNIAFGI